MRRAADLLRSIERRAPARRWYMQGPLFEYRVSSTDDDNNPRRTCTRCGFVDYENPKAVCGSVLTVDDRIILGRRAVYPRRGFWGIPAGYLEMGETVEEGAAREAQEELNADIHVRDLLALYSLPHIGQIQMIYTSVLKNGNGVDQGHEGFILSPGQETDEVALFRWEEIPWDSLAFPTTSWALWHHYQRLKSARRAGHIKSSIATSMQKADALSSGLSSDILEGGSQGKGSRESYYFQGGNNNGFGNGDPSSHSDSDSDSNMDSRVFSTPTKDMSLFWCPERGLHVKQDWRVAVDS